MQKPNNYDNTKAGGNFTPIETGGHHLVIKQVQEMKSKTGKDMVVVIFDTAAGDSQPNYFSKQFADDIRPEKKWPRNGRQYIVVEDNDGNCSKSFKSFITSVEKSNSGFETQWGDKFASQFKNKRVGGVFGEVENEYNGKTSMRHELRWFCADDKVATAGIPAPKYLPDSDKKVSAPARPAAGAAGVAGFIDVPDIDEEEIPF